MATKSKTMNAVALIKADHKKVKALFSEFEKTEEMEEKIRIAHEAIKELKIHAIIEEDIFYPAVRQEIGDEELMNEAEEEHRVAKTLIKELEKADSSDEHFEAKFTVLAENVRHHIKEEETEMLPETKDLELDLNELGKQMADRKEQLLENEKLLQEAVEQVGVKPYQELAHN